MKTLYSILLLITFSSCAPYKYQYLLSLDAPVSSNTLNYTNDTLSIGFNFTTKGLGFELYNRSKEGIRINWDELSISENGVAKRVVHKETGMTKINDLQPPTTVPPQSALKDIVVPTENIRFTTSSGRTSMIISDSYPIYDYGSKSKANQIMELKGKKIIFYFPYYIRNSFYSKTFEFTIFDIEKSKTGAYAKNK